MTRPDLLKLLDHLGFNNTSKATTIHPLVPHNPTANIVYAPTSPSHANQGPIYYATGPGPSNVAVGPGSTQTSQPYHQPAYVPAQPMLQLVLASGPVSAHVLAVSQPTQTKLSRQPNNLPHAFSTVTLQDIASGAWNMDTGASSHLNNSINSLSEIFNTCMYPSILFGDGHSILVTNTGHSIFPTPTKSLHLNNVLITPHIVKNLISIRHFVHDNNCTIEFDAFGFSVKDFLTRQVLLQCDNTGDLYQVTTPSPIPHAFLVSQHTWHQRLGHPGVKCCLGKHVRLPFVSSSTVISSCFDIIHSDVWTSPILNLSVDFSVKSSHSNVTMVVNSTTVAYIPFLTKMESNSAFHVPKPLNRMESLYEWFV
ncbi:hypothetical protein Tco_1134615 [Tanacetum coccineum]